MELWATATGSNGNGSDEGFQNLIGSVLSSDVSGGAARGTLKVFLASPFNGSGSTAGSQQDLDGDGDLDVGNTDPAANTSNGTILARSNVMTTTGGTVTSSGRSFKIGTATFTVTQLLGGSSTQIRFVPHISSNPFAVNAVWQEDGAIQSNGGGHNGVYQAGNSVVLTKSGGGGGGGSVGSISGNVWQDNNANGAKDAGEPNFGGFQLYIDSNFNGVKDGTEPTTFADGNGNYTFGSLLPNASYRVRAFPPSGWGTSFPFQPTPWHDVFVGSGQNIGGQNFGEKPLGGGGGGGTVGSISGNVFKDNNSNGTWDAGDTNFTNFQLYIDSNLNGLKDASEPTTFTDGSGHYVFSNLAPNVTYRVRAFPPSGWGTSFPKPPTPWQEVFVGSGQNITGKHFGERPLTTVAVGSISGTVFKDLNSNGTWDAGDQRFGGFQLYIDSNFNGIKDSNEPTTFADGNGNYFFGNLAPNVTYRVRALPPSGWGTSFPSPNRWHDVFVASGQNITGKHFGERPL
jgi:hypothetical protein